MIVSHFEWRQNEQHLYWDLDEVEKRLERMMQSSFNKVRQKNRIV